MAMIFNRMVLLAAVIAAATVLGCRSDSSASRVRLLHSFHSNKPYKAEDLIADSSRSAKAVCASYSTPNEATRKVALVSYGDKAPPPADLSGPSQEAQLPLRLVSLGDQQLDQITSSSANQSANKQSANNQVGSNQATDSELVKDSSDEQSPNKSDRIKLDPFPALPSVADPVDLPNAAGSLDLATLEAMAMANNPSLAQQTAIVDSLRGRWLQAGLRPNPALGFSGQQIFSQGQAEQLGLYAGQKIVRSEKLAADQQIVCREMEVALQQLAAQQRRVLTDVHQRFYEVLIAQRRRQVTAELAKIAEESLQKTNSLLEAELGTKIDVLRSTIERQETGIQYETAQNQVMAAWRQLSAVVGQPEMPLQTLQGNIDPVADLERDSLVQQLLQESPEIVEMFAQRQRAQAQLHRAMVEPLPDVDIQSVVQHDNGVNGTNAMIQVSLPIPLRNRNQGAIAEARMQLAAAQYAQQKTEFGLHERLASVWQRYESASVQVQGFAKPDGVLSNSRRTLELIRKAYDAGEIGSLELITAQRVYSQTSLQYLTALSEYWSSRIELEGWLLKGSLQN